MEWCRIGGHLTDSVPTLAMFSLTPFHPGRMATASTLFKTISWLDFHQQAPPRMQRCYPHIEMQQSCSISLAPHHVHTIYHFYYFYTKSLKTKNGVGHVGEVRNDVSGLVFKPHVGRSRASTHSAHDGHPLYFYYFYMKSLNNKIKLYSIPCLKYTN